MSHYVTPFLVLNLGSEMVFVIAHRLQAQNVSTDRSTLVLEDLISALTSKLLIADLMKSHEVWSQEVVREVIEGIANSSSMRLDSGSMSKMWDLITMIFKWQVNMSNSIIDITMRHIQELDNFVASEKTQLQLHRVKNIIENFNKMLDHKEKVAIHESIMYWTKDFNVRVSLLLRMGLQDMNGNFVVEHLDPMAATLLKNIGENIYQVTQNGRILENQSPEKPVEKQENINELQLFVHEMLGERKASAGSVEGNFLKLSINDKNDQINDNKDENGFNNIDVNVQDNQIQDIINDLSIKNEDADTNFRDDLLDLINDNDEKENKESNYKSN